MSKRNGLDVDALISEIGIVGTAELAQEIDELLAEEEEHNFNGEDVEIDVLIEMLDDDFISPDEEILLHNKTIKVNDDLMDQQQDHLESLLVEYSGSCMSGDLDDEELDMEFSIGGIGDGGRRKLGTDIRKKYKRQIEKLTRFCNKGYGTLDVRNRRQLKNTKLMMLSRGVLAVAPFTTIYAVSRLSNNDAHKVMQQALGLDGKFTVTFRQKRALEAAKRCDRKYQTLTDLWDSISKEDKLVLPSPQQVIADSVKQLDKMVKASKNIRLSNVEKVNVKRMRPASERARLEVRKRQSKRKKPSLFRRLFKKRRKPTRLQRKSRRRARRLRRRALPAVQANPRPIAKPQPVENYDALLENPYIFAEDIAMLKELDKKRRKQ